MVFHLLSATGEGWPVEKKRLDASYAVAESGRGTENRGMERFGVKISPPEDALSCSPSSHYPAFGLRARMRWIHPIRRFNPKTGRIIKPNRRLVNFMTWERAQRKRGAEFAAAGGAGFFTPPVRFL